MGQTGTGRRDALVRVPSALGGFARGVTLEGEPIDPQHMLRLALAENSRLTEENAGLRADVAALRRDLRSVGDMGSAMASVSLSLMRMLLDRGYADGPSMVRIPRVLHDRMVGASIRLGRGVDESITVTLRDEGKERVVSDERG